MSSSACGAPFQVSKQRTNGAKWVALQLRECDLYKTIDFSRLRALCRLDLRNNERLTTNALRGLGSLTALEVLIVSKRKRARRVCASSYGC